MRPLLAFCDAAGFGELDLPASANASPTCCTGISMEAAAKASASARCCAAFDSSQSTIASRRERSSQTRAAFCFWPQLFHFVFMRMRTRRSSRRARMRVSITSRQASHPLERPL